MNLDQNKYIKLRREALAKSLQGKLAIDALLCLMITRLKHEKTPLKSLMTFASKQGYTLPSLRLILEQLTKAELIEYIHEHPLVNVRLNDDGVKFVEGVIR